MTGSSDAPLKGALRSDSFKYEHLNLNIGTDRSAGVSSLSASLRCSVRPCPDENGFPIKGAKRLTREPRIVSLYFLEKFSMLLWYFQVHGLIWVMTKPWPWPQQ